MERFYIIENKEIISEIKDFHKNSKKRAKFIKDFFDKHGIDGERYYMGGNGFLNVPFEESRKKEICLYIQNTKSNIDKFGSDFKKNSKFDDLSELKKSSSLLKELQDECVKNQIVINLDFVRFADYFEELNYFRHRRTFFEYDSRYYLSIASDEVHDIIPIADGFIEIKGSEFHKMYEELTEV